MTWPDPAPSWPSARWRRSTRRRPHLRRGMVRSPLRAQRAEVHPAPPQRRRRSRRAAPLAHPHADRAIRQRAGYRHPRCPGALHLNRAARSFLLDAELDLLSDGRFLIFETGVQVDGRALKRKGVFWTMAREHLRLGQTRGHHERDQTPMRNPMDRPRYFHAVTASAMQAAYHHQHVIRAVQRQKSRARSSALARISQGRQMMLQKAKA